MSQPNEAHGIIYDGLLQATQSLSKLGSNLALRAKNIKNDKIVVTKLSNNDEINSAVTKLLLICELSKKSLDGVQDGVRKVVKDYKYQRRVEKLKANRKTINCKKFDWHTMEVGNYFLKIKKGINLTEYTKARVALKRLDKPVIDKYIGKYNEIYNKKWTVEKVPDLDASRKTRISDSSSNNGKKQRLSSLINGTAQTTNHGSDNISRIEKADDSIKHKNKKNWISTEEMSHRKETKTRVLNANKNLSPNEKKTQGRNNNNANNPNDINPIIVTKVQSQTSFSDERESKEKGILNNETEENMVKDCNKKSVLEQKEDEETQKSLGKISSTGGSDKIRIKCVDINKLIDKAKENTFMSILKSPKNKPDLLAKIKNKKGNSLPSPTKIEKKRKESFLLKETDFKAKPFSITVIRMCNDLEALKYNCNIKKIVYKNKEILNLNDIAKFEKESLLKERQRHDEKQSNTADIDLASSAKHMLLSESENERKKRSSSHSESITKTKKIRCSDVKSGINSSQTSETQDSDEDIDRLTDLNRITRTSRRRKTDSTSNNGEIKEKGRKKTTKKKDCNIVLHSDRSSCSNEPSDTEGSDAATPFKDTGIVECGAKAELLDEVDSNNEEVSEKEGSGVSGSSDEDRIKKKRRKGNAIKSDLEADTTRKVDEDSDEENSKPVRRNRKKKTVQSSDASGDSSNDDSRVKKKRRKGDAIKSHSKADTTRRVDEVDSDEENSEPVKSKRKKETVPSSDASGDSSNDDSHKKKRRRRIKQVDDGDMSGSGSDAKERRQSRKNIRKVMGKGKLEEATLKAARVEKERLARIAERQRLYNNLDFDETGKPDEVVLEKVVLDFDPETKEPLIQVDKGLVRKLKPHQANGIKFMWDACFESVQRIKKDKGSGCILAHCMGLGKTLQVISLTHTLLTHGELTGVRRVLVVCPLSTVLNWVNEINMWLEHAETDTEVDVFELTRFKQNAERAKELKRWYKRGGICVLGYEMYRNLSAENSKKFRKIQLEYFQKSLVNPGPDLVVCDEGHLLKNQYTSLSQSINRIETRRRIVLTGTPLQNNLKEYYCMVTFVKPNLLGKYNEYLNRFVNPITNGQYTDSTEHDIKIMKRRSHVLHTMLDGAVQRRDYRVLAPFLPPKHEFVVFITLSVLQTKLYQHYMDEYSRKPTPGKISGSLFADFQSLQRIWTHPLVLKYNSERYEIMQQKKRDRGEQDSEGSLADFIDDDESTTDESSSNDYSDMSCSDNSRKNKKKEKSDKKSKAKESKETVIRCTRANPDTTGEVLTLPEDKNENPTEWWIKLVNDAELEDMRNSHKLVLLFDILRQCDVIGDKVLVFSQSLYSLDLIEHYLEKIDEATQEGRVDEKLGGHVGSWSPGVDYFRLDGSTSCENRSIWCNNFNREDNPRARLFLISTRAGGLGINLVAANRVVIFDVSWNPSHDVQSIFRVYRFGQKKPCYVYRFLAMGTMEEKIYERQVTKQAISKRVIDEQQIDRHYKENDLAELYKFEPKPPEPRPLPALPKDRLFAEILKNHVEQIYKYHEHDSLLENKEEETLTEEERKAAWEDFENEKNRPPPAPMPTMRPMHNGMAANLIAQQNQQQHAYLAVVAALRKDVPNINDQQIREMLPLICSANPALASMFSRVHGGRIPMSMPLQKQNGLWRPPPQPRMPPPTQPRMLPPTQPRMPLADSQPTAVVELDSD